MGKNFRDLTVYKKVFRLAMKIFEISKVFHEEEKYSLTDQLRRSSRSVCRAIGEGYRKRPYPEYFSNKISDADMGNTETQVSLDFAHACGYISEKTNLGVRRRSEEVGRLLNQMIQNPEKYQRKSQRQ